MSLLSAEKYLESLAVMVPFHNSQRPPVIPHLQEILNLCKRAWVCDFLFNNDDSHLTILTSPFNIRSAVACSISIKRFQPPIVLSPHDYHFDGSIVFVPAHSVDHISVGFGIEEKTYSYTQTLDTEPRDAVVTVPRYIEQFRWVRDDKNGTLIILYDFGDYLQFEYASHVSTKCRQRSTSRFNRQMLMSLVQMEYSLDEEKLLPAMICLQIADEYRVCPSCGVTPETPCNCSSSFVPPKHSLDFSNHASQMASHAGSFEGMLHLVKFTNGKPGEQLTLGNRISMEGGSSHDLVSRLSRWVISKHLQSVKQDPMATILPPAPEEVDQWDDPSVSLPLNECPSTSAAIEFVIRAQDPNGIRAGGVTVETPVAEHQGEDFQPPPFATATAAIATSQAFRQADTHRIQVHPMAKMSDIFRTGALDDMFSQEVDTGQTPGTTQSLYINPTELSVIQQNVGMEPLTAAQLQQIERQREKEKKQEIKKERNRASAQRSNLRKKQEKENQKREIQRLRGLEVKLRAREQVLRNENLRLRGLAAGQRREYNPF